MKPNVVIIGSGNLAESLAIAVAECEGLNLLQLWARNPERGRVVADLAHCPTTADPQALAEADIYLIAVSDRAVREVAELLPIPPAAIVAHTAGSVEMEALNHYPRRGIFYPFQGFSAGRKVCFEHLPIFIEAIDEEVKSTLWAAASALSRQVYEADSVRRSKIHLAGVIANNFVNQLYQSATDLLASEGLPFEVLKPLIEETAQKAIDAEAPKLVQTGPAKRGDITTQQRHLTLLEEQQVLQTIYKELSQLIWETSKKI